MQTRTQTTEVRTRTRVRRRTSITLKDLLARTITTQAGCMELWSGRGQHQKLGMELSE